MGKYRGKSKPLVDDVLNHLVKNLSELVLLGELNQIQPDYISNPLGWFGRTGFQVKCSSS